MAPSNWIPPSLCSSSSNNSSSTAQATLLNLPLLAGYETDHAGTAIKLCCRNGDANALAAALRGGYGRGCSLQPTGACTAARPAAVDPYLRAVDLHCALPGQPERLVGHEPHRQVRPAQLRLEQRPGSVGAAAGRAQLSIV